MGAATRRWLTQDSVNSSADMDDSTNKPPPDRIGRNLIKAFTCVGAILGAGALGLLKTVSLFGEQMGWFSSPLRLGAGYWWIVGGAALGFLSSWLLVRSRRGS